MVLAMLAFFKQVYLSIEALKGRKLVAVLLIIFLTFIALGIAVGYFIPSKLTGDEISVPQTGANEPDQSTAPTAYKGIVTYLGEDAYPLDKITYALTDREGNDIILLRVSDERLSIVQGLYVEVTGKKGKTMDGKNDVLEVSEVAIKNGSN